MMAVSDCHVLESISGTCREGIDLAVAVARGDVAIVSADLNCSTETIEGCPDFLSKAEQDRAREYVRDFDRIQFIRRRILLRRWLGEILGCDPKGIVIQQDPSGRPYLDPEGLLWPLSFSMSHSRGRAIYAFARKRQVGIDIEYRNPAVEAIKLAEVVCTPAERNKLASLTGPEQCRGFYDCWCAKEAFIKAVGIREPTSFELSFWPGDLRLVCDRSGPEDLMRWSFRRLNCGADWSAVLVAEEGCGGFKVTEIDASRALAL